MVGRLNLQDVPELVDTKKKGDGVLDSPDSGLPPSPSPSHWGLTAAGGGGGERAQAPGALEPDVAATPVVSNSASLPTPQASVCAPRLCPLSFGEGVEFDPLPLTEVRDVGTIKLDAGSKVLRIVPDGTLPQSSTTPSGISLTTSSCPWAWWWLLAARQSPVSPTARGATIRLSCVSSPATSRPVSSAPPLSTPSTPRPSTPLPWITTATKSGGGSCPAWSWKPQSSWVAITSRMSADSSGLGGARPAPLLPWSSCATLPSSVIHAPRNLT
ncbi:refilin-B isoform 1-T1 [Rhynchonycteris naso]